MTLVRFTILKTANNPDRYELRAWFRGGMEQLFCAPTREEIRRLLDACFEQWLERDELGENDGEET